MDEARLTKSFLSLCYVIFKSYFVIHILLQNRNKVFCWLSGLINMPSNQDIPGLSVSCHKSKSQHQKKRERINSCNFGNNMAVSITFFTPQVVRK